MPTVKEGNLLWSPNDNWIQDSNVFHFSQWLQNNKQLHFNDYNSLWQWSITNIESFWETIWEYFQVQAKTPYKTILTSHQMPGAKWFPEATINYTEHVFRNRKSNKTAIIHASENRKSIEVTWETLYQHTSSLQQTLKKLGVQKGDRVVAYVPNIYEAVVSFLATASLGAIWSSASPDFGTQSVIDRFKQIEPKVMITIDGYLYGGKEFNRLNIVKEIQSELPTLNGTIAIPYLDNTPDFSVLKNVIYWDTAIKQVSDPLTYEYIPFNDPLWILFSSGTTGKPKPIVHSQGGILLEHLKALSLHSNIGEDDRFFWYTTTGWMMWNYLVGGLLTGATIVLYDGSPTYPDDKSLWKLVEQTKITLFGTSASYITACMKNNIQPKKDFDLSHLTSISSTGSPLSPEGFEWCYNNVKKDLWIASISGGTDVCTAFITGSPILPVYAGELQCPGLGAKVESYLDNGQPVVNEIGELVLTEPLPSMPIYFWNDPGNKRLEESYFDMFPGIWRHGDYVKVTERNTCVIYGRSDATINRGGIRIGTSEIYRAVDKVEEVVDSLIVDIPIGKGDSFTPLFVVMKDEYRLSEEQKKKIKQQIRTHCSPRHVPTDIYEVQELPKTLNGKKLEVPIKKILMGQPVEQVVNKGSLANEKALDYYVELARELKNTKKY